MALARINGPMLQANLERQGQNISIDAAAFFDVNNYRVGINNSSPQYTLDVNGTAHMGNFYIVGNTLSTVNGSSIVGNVAFSNVVSFANTINATSPYTGTITVAGGVGIAQDLWVGGNVYANAVVSENISILSVIDPLLYLTSNAPYPYNYDLGFYSHFVGGSGNVYQHTGLVRNHIDNHWYLFSNTPEPTGSTVDLANSRVILDTLTAGGAIFANSTPSTNNSTGALVVTGGVGVGGNINVLGSNGNAIVTTANVWTGYIFANANINTTGSFVGNLTGNVVGTVLTPYQPNITTVGTLANLAVTANTATGNILTNGLFYANGVVWNFGSTYANANVASYLLTYTGNLSPGNVTSVFYGNVHADVITPYQTTVTVFNNTGAIGIPSGSNVQYPTSNVAGYLRYNNTISTLEFYNGTGWVSITNSISDQTITPDGVNQNFALTQVTTAAGILVSINGTVQRPGVAYTVSGTTITFTEVPLVTDIVDVRYIATAVSSTLDYEIVDTGNITVNVANTIVDSFSNTQYRSARYMISSTSLYDSQFSEIMLVQNGATVVVNTIGNVRTGANTITYSANVNNGTVNLLAAGSTALNQLRIQRTYFNI